MTELPKRTKPAVAICGFTDHRVQALDLPDERFERWALNELYRFHPDEVRAGKFDRWFEIHDRKDFDKPAEQGGDPDHPKSLATFPIPVYVNNAEDWQDVKSAVQFPREAVEEALGSKYFTSTPAWMLGLAIAMGFEEIHMYGVDMATDTEYVRERPCVEHWFGVAKGRGIKIVVPPTSDLLKSVGQYGFGEVGTEFSMKLSERLAWLHRQDNDALAQLRKLEADYEETKERLENEYRAKREQMLVHRSLIFGAIQDCNFWQRSWAVQYQGGDVTPDRTKDERTGIVQAPSGDSAEKRVATVANRIKEQVA